MVKRTVSGVSRLSKHTLKKPRLQLGIIGCGRAAGQLHLPSLKRVNDLEVVALADVERPRLDALADQFGVTGRYSDYRRLLADPRIDVVAVCVPPQLHVEISLAVIDAGKHLFVEKPLALSLDDCDRLIDRARHRSVKATVGLNFRHHRQVQQAREWIQRGRLGPLELLRGSYTSATRRRMQVPAWRERCETGGSVLIEVATHQFDLWRFLLATEVEQVHALTGGGHTGDQWAVVTARMANGVLVSAGFSEQTYDNCEIEVFGRSGRLQLSLYRFDGLEFSPIDSFAGDLKSRTRGIKRTLTELPRGLLAMRRGGDYVMTYERQWRHFAGAIRGGGNVAAALDDGRAAVAIALAAMESANTGMPVAVGEVAAPTT
jgi:predicted dehydrogenase